MVGGGGGRGRGESCHVFSWGVAGVLGAIVGGGGEGSASVLYLLLSSHGSQEVCGLEAGGWRSAVSASCVLTGRPS